MCLWTPFGDLMLQSAKGLPSSSGKIPKNISQNPLIRSLNGIYWQYSEFSDGHYIVSVRKFTATPNTGDSRGILPHSVMYGAIQMLVRYERFGEILREDFVFMDAVRGFDAPIRQRASIFVRKNTKKYLQKPLIRSRNGIYWRYSEFSDRHYIAP